MRMAVLGLAVLVGAPAHAERPAAPPAPAARIEQVERSYEAGKVQHGQPVRHVFLVRNLGNADLSMRVTPDPGCTVEAPDSVPPGGIGRIVAIFDTTPHWGLVTKTIRVATNDPDVGIFLLAMSAEVMRAIEVTPAGGIVMMGTAERLKPVDVTLAAVDGKPFDITSVDATAPLTASVAPAGAPVAGAGAEAPRKKPSGARGPVAQGSSRYLLTIQARPDVALGRSFAKVTVGTSHPAVPTIPIEVTIGVQGSVLVDPDRVLFHPAATTKQVKLKKPDGGAFEILGVESSDPDFKVTKAALEAGREYELTVTYTGRPGRTVDARLTVRTNDPRQREIVIPLRGKV